MSIHLTLIANEIVDCKANAQGEERCLPFVILYYQSILAIF